MRRIVLTENHSRCANQESVSEAVTQDTAGDKGDDLPRDVSKPLRGMQKLVWAWKSLAFWTGGTKDQNEPRPHRQEFPAAGIARW